MLRLCQNNVIKIYIYPLPSPSIKNKLKIAPQFEAWLPHTYGNVAKKPLNEQTSAVYNILQELKGKYALSKPRGGKGGGEQPEQTNLFSNQQGGSND